jgi:hypothetical protein
MYPDVWFGFPDAVSAPDDIPTIYVLTKVFRETFTFDNSEDIHFKHVFRIILEGHMANKSDINFELVMAFREA